MKGQWSETGKYIAHTANEDGNEQLLSDHLLNTARLASEFARIFGAEEEANVAGILHDLGKYKQEFQRYIRGEIKESFETHHAVYGGRYAFDKVWACSLAIAGHHTGLKNKCDTENLVRSSKYKADQKLPLLQQKFVSELNELPDGFRIPDYLNNNELVWEFYIRMLFSCLVDADYLDTEAHYRGKDREVIKLGEVVDSLLAALERERDAKSREGLLNQTRHQIFDQCLEKANLEPGFFSLTVPTGGGKTLSGMAFALAHAKKWGLRRVIVVIPYLSIIEQNAQEYGRILDPENRGIMVEHHSAIKTGPDEREECTSINLAAENWDAPIIVTTSVQFIESLFASSPSKCRKLHNIAGSVVVFDEVQTLPVDLLNPFLSVMKELRDNYRVSTVFMTATQPAFTRHGGLTEGFKPGEVREIIDNPPRIFNILKRVEYERIREPLNFNDLGGVIAGEKQCLCVLNTKKQAAGLWETVKSLVSAEEKESVIHLSSSMCANHRSDILGSSRDPEEGSVRWLLKNNMPCRLISTQVVEAGVDLDFPYALRAMGPLDSIAQTAGRCNRENKLMDASGNPVPGRVIIFTPEDNITPSGVYKKATQVSAVHINSGIYKKLAENPEIFGAYFSELYDVTDQDRKMIQHDRKYLRFKKVSCNAKVIKDDVFPVIVNYCGSFDIVREIRDRRVEKASPRITRHDLRRLQRSIINIRVNDFNTLEGQKALTGLLPGLDLYVLSESYYHASLGLLVNNYPTEELCGV